MKHGEKCTCPEKTDNEFCAACGGPLPGYWCEVCKLEVAEKRCPFCGLKARKIREEDR